MRHKRLYLFIALVTVLVIVVHDFVPHHHHVDNFVETNEDSDHHDHNEIDESMLFSFIEKHHIDFQNVTPIVEPNVYEFEIAERIVFGIVREFSATGILKGYETSATSRGPPQQS